jgi:hypothetical protein
VDDVVVSDEVTDDVVVTVPGAVNVDADKLAHENVPETDTSPRMFESKDNDTGRIKRKNIFICICSRK